MAQMGRIGGPLLADNLLRNGANLAFESQVLYLNVTGKYIGVGTAAPSADLTVSGTTSIPDLSVTTAATFTDVEFTSNQIQNPVGSITFSPTLSGGTQQVIVPNLGTINSQLNPILLFSGNTISNSYTNSDINFSPNGTGTINFANGNGNVQVTVTGGNSLHATGNITFDGNITLGSSNTDTIDFTAEVDSDILPSASGLDNLGSSGLEWNNAYVYNSLGNFYNPYFSITGNTIAGTVSNSTVYYTANGSSNVNLEYLSVYNNNITNVWPSPANNTQASVIFAPNGTGNVQVNSTQSLILPIGDDSSRVLSANGEIRFNDINLNIEGYENSGYVNFINLYSQDHNTYITAELTPGAADNTLRFAVNNTVTTTISSTTVSNSNLVAGSVAITSNTIQNTNGAQNLAITANGTGQVNLQSFVGFGNNTIVNNTNSDILFQSEDGGHWKFGGTNGVGLPTGGTSSRPGNPQNGAVRYNSDLSAGEIYSSTQGWMPWVGLGNTVITQDQDQDLTYVYTLILGY